MTMTRQALFLPLHISPQEQNPQKHQGCLFECVKILIFAFQHFWQRAL
jgi:hypothetical protein